MITKLLCDICKRPFTADEDTMNDTEVICPDCEQDKEINNIITLAIEYGGREPTADWDDVKKYITSLLAQEKSQLLKEIIGEEKVINPLFPSRCAGYNQKRQEILDRAKKLHNIEI